MSQDEEAIVAAEVIEDLLHLVSSDKFNMVSTTSAMHICVSSWANSD